MIRETLAVLVALLLYDGVKWVAKMGRAWYDQSHPPVATYVAPTLSDRWFSANELIKESPTESTGSPLNSHDESHYGDL